MIWLVLTFKYNPFVVGGARLLGVLLVEDIATDTDVVHRGTDTGLLCRTVIARETARQGRLFLERG